MKLIHSGAMLLLAVVASAGTITLDNGITGDGRWEVAVDSAGRTTSGNITAGGTTYDVIYSYRNSVNVGSGDSCDDHHI